MEVVAVFIILILIILAQVLLFSKNMFKNFLYTCKFSRAEVFEGESIEMVETVLNGKGLPIPSLRAEITASRFLDFYDTDSLVNEEVRFVPSFFMLKGYQKITRRWDVTCTRRGEHGVRSLVLISTDLLGLKTLSKPIPVDQKVLVLPTPIDLDAYFVSPRLLQGDFVVRRSLVDDPFFVSDVREYTPSDSLKQIHWAATAKTGEIMVRNYDYTNRQNLTVILNMQSRDSERGKVGQVDAIETAIKVCAAIFEQAQQLSIAARFATNAGLDNSDSRSNLLTPEYSSEEGTYELLRVLARLTLRSSRDVYDLLREVEEGVLTSDVILVTCYINRYIEEFAKRLYTEHNIRLRVLLLDWDKGNDYYEEMEIYYLNEALKEAAAAHVQS